MTLLTADFVFTCKNDFEIIQEGGVLFDTHIIEVGKACDLQEKYPNVSCIHAPPHSVILPGLINTHVHLEFSANQTMLEYGDFIVWLQSVIKHREELSLLATTELIETKLKEMLQSGTTTLGAISSFGADLEACANTPQRVVYFNEVLGSIPSAVDAMYGDFRGRLEASKTYKNERFIPAVSIHSPYSTHPILAKKALQIAKEEGCVVSTHFMESHAERVWLDEAQGDFKTFFEAFNPHAKPLCTPKEYLTLFENIPTLFTHAVHATQEELAIIKQQNATLTHCPVSNRLLGVGTLDLSTPMHEPLCFTLGTDGLSSNISLSLWDEMRSALMMHANMPLHALAKELLQSVTTHAADALKLPCGVLEKDRYADLIVATLPQACEIDHVALALILHTQHTHLNFIHGEQQC